MPNRDLAVEGGVTNSSVPVGRCHLVDLELTVLQIDVLTSGLGKEVVKRGVYRQSRRLP